MAKIHKLKVHKSTRMAIAYDFDGTLARGNMQEISFIPELGITKEAFWAEVTDLAKDEGDGMDEILAYMFLLITKASEKQVPHTRANILDHGRKIKYFPGVEEWFTRINAFAKNQNIELEHYIISSGLRELIEGTSIYKHFKAVYASSFKYDVNNVPNWPALAVNYTNKTQYLFRINKGIFNAWDNDTVNAYTPDEKRRILFPNMIYIGDGMTDVPAMKMMIYQGGTSIGLYDSKQEKTSAVAKNLLKHQRVEFIAEADYREDSRLDTIVKNTIERVSSRQAGFA